MEQWSLLSASHLKAERVWFTRDWVWFYSVAGLGRWDEGWETFFINNEGGGEGFKVAF